jgi:hypothetical protein
MGKCCRGDLEADLAQPFDHALHERLVSWYQSRAERHDQRILSCLPDAQ